MVLFFEWNIGYCIGFLIGFLLFNKIFYCFKLFVWLYIIFNIVIIGNDKNILEILVMVLVIIMLIIVVSVFILIFELIMWGIKILLFKNWIMVMVFSIVNIGYIFCVEDIVSNILIRLFIKVFI